MKTLGYIQQSLRDRLTHIKKEGLSWLDPSSSGNLEIIESIKQGIDAESSMDDQLRHINTEAARVLWWETDKDCLSNLKLLSLRSPLELRQGAVNPSVISEFDSDSAGDFILRFYRSPVNILHPSQKDKREKLLAMLMSEFKVRLEAGKKDIDLRNVFMVLNVVSVHALFSGNLRFLDAMNYYYELISSLQLAKSAPGDLLALFMGIYTRTLCFYSYEKNWNYR